MNIANLGRRPYIPLHTWIIESMLRLGFLMRGEIIWNKAASASPSTAWGSWKSAANPTLRDVHEYILVFSKGVFKRQNPLRKANTISKEEFLEFTKSVWTFPAEQAGKIGHPAPFPLELPHRLIQLYSFKDDVVLDPFMGSGQTALAALNLERHYVGYELNAEYVSLANTRIMKETGIQLRAPGFNQLDIRFSTTHISLNYCMSHPGWSLFSRRYFLPGHVTAFCHPDAA